MQGFFKKHLCFNKKRLHLQSLTNTNIGEKSGALAQLVEQRTENPCVAGSIPAGTTINLLRFILRRFFALLGTNMGTVG
jgi:hypothetical protein